MNLISGKLYRIYPVAGSRVIHAYSAALGVSSTITFCSPKKEKNYIVCMFLEQFQENNGDPPDFYPDIWNKFLWKDKTIVIPENHAEYEMINENKDAVSA